MIIDYIGVMMAVWDKLNAGTALMAAIGLGQLLDNTQAVKPPYPLVLVGFPGKSDEPHLSIGYHPRPQLIVPVEFRSWQRDAAGVDRTVKAQAVELYNLIDLAEAVIRANPRMGDGSKYIKVMPGSVPPPTLEISDNSQILKTTLNVTVDSRI